MTQKKYDLEDRLIQFAGESILFLNKIPKDFAGVNLSNQLSRSASSCALNFGESQGTITQKDKAYKLSIVLKELKESRATLKIIDYISYGDQLKRQKLIKECEELTAIIASIIYKKYKYNR